MILRTILLTFLLSSCADSSLVGLGEGTNYLTFNHPNTEKAAEEIRTRAERLCRERNQVAIRTESVCSLTKCATNYQCMDKADVIRHGF